MVLYVFVSTRGCLFWNRSSKVTLSLASCSRCVPFSSRSLRGPAALLPSAFSTCPASSPLVHHNPGLSMPLGPLPNPPASGLQLL